MQKLFEIFKILQIQKSIVSAETILGNMVANMECALFVSLCPTKHEKLPPISHHVYTKFHNKIT